MKHSSKDADRWLYHVRADVAIEGQGDDVLFNDTWERCKRLLSFLLISMPTSAHVREHSLVSRLER